MLLRLTGGLWPILPAVLHLIGLVQSVSAAGTCRSQPGDADFPTVEEWSALNVSVNGRLISVTPSAKFCEDLPCTDAEWSSSVFRATIPGAMDCYNWEQDYSGNSTCLEGASVCGQGDVPLYAINATFASDVQAGVNFASTNNLRLSIKSSGHDLLGRSTAKNSLLIWTRYLANATFSESFELNGTSVGSAVTVGPGVALNAAYLAAKAQGKIIVGGTAASVAPSGGFVQGAGHSAFSPLFGLAADVALQFKVVIANGSLLTVDATNYPDLFWAMRGGGGGSWGVIIETTFQTFDTFNVSKHTVGIIAPTNDSTGALMTIHANHIFDWDSVNAGQYAYVYPPSIPTNGLVANPAYGTSSNGLGLLTYFANQTEDQALALMKPLLDDVRAQGFEVVNETVVVELANDAVYAADNAAGVSTIMGSRFFSSDAYKTNAAGIGAAYQQLIEQGATQIGGNLVAGGKVSDPSVSNAVTPKWRAAKSHILTTLGWADSATPAEIEAVKNQLTNTLVPILDKATTEDDAGSYMSEGDVREPNFQTTFYGGNYAKLKTIKAIYDPNELFIVGAGVASENWDEDGLCRL
ncbi:FAD-binding domain-containing protein [Stereum hirsutum FP-91666 SS1]|uniref:FAD-binding domain-containing protein n=1 Tax=Stereum hirsutum (strain FP-91666) TaxID=721885 RepID=UPI0004449705|nr:FAD-binding domain-containing protein [Stereum hirsutum FP-91666 SS1]EIM85819.1 FAD-binding domain-containing protein [Stereum hirsutum FP-91666 SS1]